MPAAQRIAARAVGGLVARVLRRTFRRVAWIGPDPRHALPEGRPVVLYANHHYFHDGYVLWWFLRHVLHRPMRLWMRDWEQIPLFAPLGVLPLPADDPRARLTTIRSTARCLAEAPEHVFVYFPEGELGPPDAGVAPFGAERFGRLHGLFPGGVVWWPVALHVTWWGEDRPTALLAAGAPHEAPDGRERERLTELVAHLRTVRPTTPRIDLLGGTRSAGERWNMAPLAPLFRRLLP